MVDQPQRRLPSNRKAQGISMFEYYAGQALAGLAANPNLSNPPTQLEIKLIADRAWALATEMMTYYPSDEE